MGTPYKQYGALDDYIFDYPLTEKELNAFMI